MIGNHPGTALRGLRAREGLTQKALAQKIGITQSHVSSLENGHRPIGKVMAKKLAKTFNLNYKVFL
ncbi:MAG: helix-turn-helix transcriptional regulator [Candidatus Riflebacteria bacterium]|nr:helix-turn-helix transcriptional regulator [Candidatus Riflebacteria bacterium]